MGEFTVEIVRLDPNQYYNTNISALKLPFLLLAGRYRFEKFKLHPLIKVYGLDGREAVRPNKFEDRYFLTGPQHGIVITPIVRMIPFSRYHDILCSWMPWPNHTTLYIRFRP